MVNPQYESDIIDADYMQEQILGCKPAGLSLREEFRWSYLGDEFLSKLPRPGTPPSVRRAAAIEAMLESEYACKQINHNGYRQRTPTLFFNGVLLLAQRKIAEILGDFTYEVFEKAAFSSGASTSRTRAKGDAFYKYNTHNPVHVTPRAYKYACALIDQTPLWSQAGARANIKICMGNHIDTVPKKTLIDRAIAKEPDMNMLLQRSIGSHIRKNLLRHGINLRDQSRNQELAYFGSRTRKVATIDLRAASDSLSVRLVMDLLPLEWYSILDDLRSHHGLLPSGQSLVWEKFSSMGNGFTFELESMIFYALAYAVNKMNEGEPTHVSVYGDDIIIPTESARNLISVLHDVGFDTNIEKTFIDGPFRESCGRHYFDGLDVTPFYLRKPLNHTQRVIWLLNAIRKWSSNNTLVCEPHLHPLWLTIRRKHVDKELLGGTNLNSITSVASPDWPRKKLVSCTETKRIDGIPAVLRCFQFQSTPVEPDHVKWYDKTWDDCTDVGNEALVTVVPDRYKLIVNEDDRIRRAMYLLDLPLFPKEMMISNT